MDDQAQAAPVSAKEELKALKASLKEAKKNHKAAVAYNKSLADDAAEKQAGVDAEQGWAAEVARLEAEIAAKGEQVKAEAEAAKAAKAQNAEPKIVQNGQTQPKAGTISATLWGIFDATRERLGREPALGDVYEEAAAAGVVPGSIKAGYAQWRKFHGITGRVKSDEQVRKEAEAAEAKVQREAEKARKAEEKAAEKARKEAEAAEKKAAADAAKQAEADAAQNAAGEPAAE